MNADWFYPDETRPDEETHFVVMGMLDNGLEDFVHPETEREIQWDIRNAGTVGGNLLQDTRCRFYDRKAP